MKTTSSKLVNQVSPSTITPTMPEDVLFHVKDGQVVEITRDNVTEETVYETVDQALAALRGTLPEVGYQLAIDQASEVIYVSLDGTHLELPFSLAKTALRCFQGHAVGEKALTALNKELLLAKATLAKCLRDNERFERVTNAKLSIYKAGELNDATLLAMEIFLQGAILEGVSINASLCGSDYTAREVASQQACHALAVSKLSDKAKALAKKLAKMDA